MTLFDKWTLQGSPRVTSGLHEVHTSDHQRLDPTCTQQALATTGLLREHASKHVLVEPMGRVVSGAEP